MDTNQITLYDLLLKLSTKYPINSDIIKEAKASNINTTNNHIFYEIIEKYKNNYYKNKTLFLISELISFLN